MDKSVDQSVVIFQQLKRLMETQRAGDKMTWIFNWNNFIVDGNSEVQECQRSLPVSLPVKLIENEPLPLGNGDKSPDLYKEFAKSIPDGELHKVTMAAMLGVAIERSQDLKQLASVVGTSSPTARAWLDKYGMYDEFEKKATALRKKKTLEMSAKGVPVQKRLPSMTGTIDYSGKA